MIETKEVRVLELEIEGEKYTLIRDEMERNEELRHILTSYDQIVKDLAAIEYEREKIALAFNGQKSKLLSAAQNYIKENKMPKAPEAVETPES